jgi:hypothetical protein
MAGVQEAKLELQGGQGRTEDGGERAPGLWWRSRAPVQLWSGCFQTLLGDKHKRLSFQAAVTFTFFVLCCQLAVPANYPSSKINYVSWCVHLMIKLSTLYGHDHVEGQRDLSINSSHFSSKCLKTVGLPSALLGHAAIPSDFSQCVWKLWFLCCNSLGLCSKSNLLFSNVTLPLGEEILLKPKSCWFLWACLPCYSWQVSS